MRTNAWPTEGWTVPPLGREPGTASGRWPQCRSTATLARLRADVARLLHLFEQPQPCLFAHTRLLDCIGARQFARMRLDGGEQLRASVVRRLAQSRLAERYPSLGKLKGRFRHGHVPPVRLEGTVSHRRLG